MPNGASKWRLLCRIFCWGADGSSGGFRHQELDRFTQEKVVTTKGAATVKLLNERNKVRALALNLVEGSDHAESFGMLEKGQAALS
jgi:hypothetical protein